MLPNSTENVLCKVSVSTSVPEKNVTPSTMASAVSASLSLCASRPLRVAFLMSGPQRPDPLDDRVGGRVPHLVHDGAVGQEDDPVRVRGAVRVMGDHDDRLAEFLYRLTQEREQFGGGVGVQVAGRLVGE